jgi:sugar transferase (PEP-CTERM/EpsH1 system associated)
MIRHLNQKHHVTVATLAHSQEEVQQGNDLARHCSEVLVEVLPSPMRWIQAVGALPTLTPSSGHYFHSARLLSRIEEAQRRRRFDAVIVHCAFVAEYVRNISAPFRMLDFGDLDSRKWSDYAKYRAFPWSAGYAIEAVKLLRVERELARHFDYCTVTAQGELESYKEMGALTPARVIPNGVDTEYYRLSGTHRQDSLTVVFLGRMDYYPNVAGTLDFVEKVWPRIRDKVPDAKFRIVGSNPAARIRALQGRDGISVTGYVPDVRPHVEDAAVAVAPLSIARGTQNKVLECMAMGIPVVASAQVAKGVQAIPGRHLLVGKTSQEFADSVIALLRDRERRTKVADDARQQVISAHSWPESMKSLDEVLEPSATMRERPRGRAEFARTV